MFAAEVIADYLFFFGYIITPNLQSIQLWSVALHSQHICLKVELSSFYLHTVLSFMLKYTPTWVNNVWLFAWLTYVAILIQLHLVSYANAAAAYIFWSSVIWTKEFPYEFLMGYFSRVLLLLSFSRWVTKYIITSID